ncbi:hypothetical protein N181_30810 [Sinorhizobium fredii USDA 205]|uniref:UDP-4-amino-4, 6-dideoxy-N-acetyl-beta-L-altrosamine transaminase n=3 Tax=Rhizobium fredii TaxID=380 RepID=A0A844AHG5_RHIFR|nr:UDP-4-amino-4,6-dideoxy-N-acetyl-beta-L-altrosamine transaminase [Sinorhizobium fredii]KSV91605.1 hypothetical protein N181_30810 [Sinorhizobium fredii USDA 205]MQX12423.1 UDP-4-amino-4,6-dideoxy-N-acetyl-beta-L-altrosamine transaminase [Sinorhizobium fredii]GEC35654.1 UDP-4-amino-4,6-dideoxy-N-acetyl-beta-L-altrosami ne transaminase [Sinorhizobium fredii]GLS07442.1 UDP-4-amino-4,6-dideoxy-N-acetyl-beta-L-altrosami ne transaminase [Sinorhizobium fredii]
MNFIPYGRQWIDDQDHAAVAEALSDPMLTQGENVERFEQAIAEKVGARYCVALSSATAGLHLAVQALGEEGDAVGLTSPNSFVATSNALLYSGHRPRFIDIDSKTGNVDIEQINSALASETTVFMPVHFAGLPVELGELSSAHNSSRLKIIEDASHAIGSKYRSGNSVGSCSHSLATVFSFHPVKNLTTGEGGAITTNDEEFYERLLRLRSHGIEREPARMSFVHEGPWYYEMQALGFNYRMTGIQAALGLSQLSKLDRFMSRRSEIVRAYNDELSAIDWLRTPLASYRADVCYHLYVLQIDFAAIKMTRGAVMEKLKQRGIGSQVHYIPIYRQPYYRDRFGFEFAAFPETETYYSRCLSIPLYPAMTDDDVARVVNAVRALA